MVFSEAETRECQSSGSITANSQEEGITQHRVSTLYAGASEMIRRSWVRDAPTPHSRHHGKATHGKVTRFTYSW